MKTLRPLVLVTLLAALDLVRLDPTFAKTTFTPCDPGRYVVLGEPLIIGTGEPLETDGVDYGDMIAVDSGCALQTPLRLKATKNGTRFKVKWLACEGIFGKVSMSGRIDTTCQTMTGVFKAKKAKVRRSYTATKSFCGDDIYDPFLEDCEGASGCVGGVCLPDCTCVGGVTTTSTSIGGTSSTLGTSSTSTSTSSSTSTTSNARPDFVPTAFTSSGSTIVSGQQLTVSWTVENQGAAAAAAGWYDLVTLSTDQIPSGDDTTLVSPYRNSALAVAATYSVNGQAITIPATTAAGTYYLLLQTDGYSSITESDETNNAATAIEITVQTPDLVPTVFTSSRTTIESGQQMTVSFTVENQGTGAAIGAWYDFVTLSTDQFPSQNDTVLAQPYRSTQVAAGASYSVNGQTITIPGTLTAGTYYLFFQTDAYGYLFEDGQDANNVWPMPIEITVQTPDLVPTAFTSSGTTIVSGQQMTVSFTVENQGSGAAIGAWYDFVTLSTDQFPSQNDTVLAQPYRSTQVAAGASYSVNGQTITIPGTLTAGTYYLLFQTDAYAYLFEDGQDANNIWSMPIEITVQTPDLVPTAFTSSGTTITAGQQLTVSWTVENQGSGAAIGAWYDFVTLSADQFPGQNDTVLAQPYRSTQVAAGANYSVNGQTITIPGTLTAGTYYLFFQTDAYAYLFEDGQDANNLWPTPIEITVQTPDLVPTAFTSSTATITAGQQMTVSWTVENQGTGAAIGAWYDFVTLSADQFPSQNDTVLAQPYRSTQVAAGANYSVNGQTVTIPGTLTAGTYYLFFQTDAYAYLFEDGQDANNLWPTPIELTVQTPDLVPTVFTSSTATITAGQQMTVSFTVENQGTGAAIGAWYDFVTLSADQFPSQNDTVLAQPYRSTQVAAGANYSLNGQTITIPGTLTPGTYYLLLQIDVYAYLFEDGQDANNLWPTPIAITVN